MNDQTDGPDQPLEPDDTRPVTPPDPATYDDTHRILPPDPTLHGQVADPPVKQRFSERLWSLRALIAVALASVILGGLGGAALASASDGGQGDGRFGPGPGRFQRGGPGMVPPGGNGRQGQRFRQWQEQHGMGQRQWSHQQPPGVVPSPPTPTPGG